jgi:dTDP-glucose pyrophosphorylase
MQIKWREQVMATTATVADAIQILDKSAGKIVLVVDGSDHLVGVAVDGDIRRGLLRGVSLTDSIDVVLNTNPLIAQADEDPEKIEFRMKQAKVEQAPVIDENGHLIGIHYLRGEFDVARRPNAVVIMAGGLGSRLRPLTDNIPKPMLTLGDRPILEIIIRQLKQQGFHHLYISVNHLREIIREYFGVGDELGVSITYLEEHEELGTAGAVSLLPGDLNHPFVVMNADVLSKVNFAALIDFHQFHNADATMGVTEFNVNVPYGVAHLQGIELRKIEEKPVVQMPISAGINVFNPRILQHIEAGQRLDMPELFHQLIAKQLNVIGFPIHEYWIDIGRATDLKRAAGDINVVEF